LFTSECQPDRDLPKHPAISLPAIAVSLSCSGSAFEVGDVKAEVMKAVITPARKFRMLLHINAPDPSLALRVGI